MSASLLETVLTRLRERQAEARDRFGIEFIGVFGSLARGEHHHSSDIDVLMEIVGPTTYFRLGEFEAELEQQLGRPVDLVDRGQLRPAVRAQMERDLVPV